MFANQTDKIVKASHLFKIRWGLALPPWAVVLCLLWVAPISAFAEDWPHWRGINADGISGESEIPLHWDRTTGVAWQVDLPGRGSSTPIVVDGRVIVTSQTGSGPVGRGRGPGQLERAGNSEVAFQVQAFDGKSGTQLWHHQIDSVGELTPVHSMHNLASPSAISDGERIIVWFGTGQLVAYDLDGEVEWQRNLAEDYGPFMLQWGHGSSPTLAGDRLILLCDHTPESYLLAVDKRTGQTLWRTHRGSGERGYSTPLAIDRGNRFELIVSSNDGIDGYDDTTGKLLWHYPDYNKVPVPMPVFADGILYTSRGYNSGPYLALKLGEAAGELTEVLWRHETGAPYVSSPLLYEGLIYLASEGGILSVIDPGNGDLVWRTRLGDSFWSSPVGGQGRVYLLGESGETVVIEAGSEYIELARNPLDERSVASPAIADGMIYLRTDRGLWAISGVPGTGTTEDPVATGTR